MIPDLYLNNEQNSNYFFNKFNKYIYKYKRNIIYNGYLENLWERILIDKNSNNNNIYNNFPSKEKLIDLYKKNDNLFHKIKDLIRMGFPNLTARNILWNKLLNIKELVAKTGIKLSDYDLLIM